MFQGCFALTCSKCHTGFCAWCLANCGRDAHSHVARCVENKNGRDVFGSIEQFNNHHNNRRRLEVIKILRAKSEKVIRLVMGKILKPLSNLSIEIKFEDI